MIRDAIKNYKVPKDSPEEMVFFLTRFRDDLMEYYSSGIGFDLDDRLPCLDMILRLDKDIRHYKWVIQNKKDKEEYTRTRNEIKNGYE